MNLCVSRGVPVRRHTKLYSTATGHTGVNNLPSVVMQSRPDRESNSRPLDRKSDAQLVAPHATQVILAAQSGLTKT